MKNKIIVVLALMSLIVLSGCNPHSGSWDRESCRIAGYEEPEVVTIEDIIKCEDKCGTLEVGIHYKKLELLRKYPEIKIQPDYIKKIEKDSWCNIKEFELKQERECIKQHSHHQTYKYTYCDFRESLDNDCRTIKSPVKLKEFDTGASWLRLEE